jgi:glyoxylate reductase
MRVLYCDPCAEPPRIWGEVPVPADFDFGPYPVSLTTLLAESDFVSIHVPLTEATHHLMGWEHILRMKPTACLINTSRGKVVDEQALVRALREKRIAGAGLDVYENEPALAAGLAGLDQAVLLPHIGSATAQTRLRMAMTAVENVIAGLEGRRVPNLVNTGARGGP